MQMFLTCCSMGSHMLCLWSKHKKGWRPLLSGRSLGVACCLLPRLSALFWGQRMAMADVYESNMFVCAYADNKHALGIRHRSVFFSFSLYHTNTRIDTMWQRCNSPVGAYTTRQMVVCFTVHPHPDWFICLSVLVPSLFCPDSKLFRAISAATVTTISICWISLLTLIFVTDFFLCVKISSLSLFIKP